MILEAKAGAEAADGLHATLDRAVRRIPPLWPLAASVAVNPFLGHTGERLAETGAVLARVGGAPVTMPRSWRQDRIATGVISDADLTAALQASPYAEKPGSVAALKAAAAQPAQHAYPLPTVADLAAVADETDWTGLIAERVGAWAGAYFDEGQALWSAPKGKSAWAAYRAYATHDLTAEIIGLAGFAAFVADAPGRADEAIARAVETLRLSGDALELYCHRLLMSLGGWAQYARYRLWRAELAGETDQSIVDLLAIRLLWEEALLCLRSPGIAKAWADAKAEYAKPVRPDAALVVDEILQEAAERAAQRALEQALAAPALDQGDGRPRLQAAFCIDVRSEVFRRALESVDPTIRTLGFAGFFGVFARHRRFASDLEELRLPVLLNPTVSSCATDPKSREADASARYAARGKRAWGRFKLAAVSSFAFVEAMGPVYIGKLIRDGLGLKPTKAFPDPKPHFEPALDLDTRVDAAETALRAMSLTDGFARLALLAGHGANVVNNPHESSLHCGACGGYSGEVNARLLASLLNDQDVRKGLVGRGIAIPDDTVFIAGLHDTTTDQVTLYEQDVEAGSHAKDIEQARQWLASAGERARGERALKLPRAANERDLMARARDWSEIRPEWGLAGCKAFIAAPRSRTTGRSLEGATFLHDYDWKPDSANGFKVLELIMTAPVVVASWISLQYYGSTAAPEIFGAGDKLLHNVVGGIGVFEGNGGLLRAGLPWQSVHDGEKYVHEPLRLAVCIEAPREAMTDILRRRDEVRPLFENRWLHLFALDETGQMAWRYSGDFEWEPMRTGPADDLLAKEAS